MPDKNLDPVDATDNTNASQQSPAPTLTPPVEGYEYCKGCHSKCGGQDVAKNTQKPTHWTAYIEAASAVLLVLITGTYTYYSAKQTCAAINAANAATSAAQTASDSLKLTKSIFQATQVAIFNPEINFAWVHDPILRVALTNVGTVPAKNVTGIVTVTYFNAAHVRETRSKRFQRLAVIPRDYVQPWIRLNTGFDISTMQNSEAQVAATINFEDGINPDTQQSICRSAYFEGPTSVTPIWEDCQDKQSPQKQAR